MSNGIDIVIGSEVSGALSGLQRVEAATNKTVTVLGKIPAASVKTSQALSKIPQASNQATSALINLGRVAQDAPFGIIGIANNLNPLLESFQRTAKEAGSFGGTLKALGASLLGGGGLGLALSVATGFMSYFAMGSRKAKEEVDLTKKATEEAEQAQKKFNDAVDAASSAVVNQSNKLSDLRYILISTGDSLDELSKKTVNQAVTQYLFTQKRDLLEKLIGEKLKGQLETGEKLLKSYQNFQLTGNESFGRDTEVQIEKINRLAKVLGVTFNEVFSKTFDKGAKKIKVDDFKPFSGDLFSGNIKIEPPPADETKREATTFGQMFYEETNNYLKRKEPIDISLINAVKAEKEFQSFVDSIDRVFNSAALDSISAFGESIGNAFSGGNFKDIFGGFLSTIGSGVQAIGKQIIALSLTAETLKKALKAIFTNPALGIAAGIGLVAVGAAIKNLSNKGLGGSRASGGPVTAGVPYLVGETGRELFVPNTSGQIVPNGRLGAMQSGGGGGSFGRQRQVVRGQNIILAYARTNRSQGRLGG